MWRASFCNSILFEVGEMGGTVRRVLLLLTIPLVTAKPSGMEEGVPLSVEMPQSRQDIPAEDFSGGFSKDFALDLPTNEFLGNFHGRPKRQVGITSAIDGILNSPYDQDYAKNHLQALLIRNSFERPVRQSAGSRPSSAPRNAESSRFSAPSQFSSQSSLQSQSPRTQSPFSRRPTLQNQSPRTQSSFSRRPTFPIRRPESRTHQRRQQQQQQQPNFDGFGFQPPRDFSSSRFRPLSRRDNPHFPSTSFTSEQFKDPFPSFRRSSSPHRAHRQKRQASANTGITSEIGQILRSPYSGPIPSSITSLYNRNNRFPRKSQPDSSASNAKVGESPKGPVQRVASSPNPFAFPFEIPNFFQKLNIKKRSTDAIRRQGISTSIDDIISSTTYQGSVPTIQNLLDFNKNRFVRKTRPSSNPNPDPRPRPFASPQPQPFPHPPSIAQSHLPVSQSRPFPQAHQVAQPSFTPSRPVASDHPSTAAGRLVPSFGVPGSEFRVNLGSGHIFFSGNQGRRKRSADPRQFNHPRNSKRFHQTRRAQRHNFHRSNRLRFPPKGRPQHDSKPEVGNNHENDFDFPVEGIQSLDFWTNFNAPFEGEDNHADLQEQAEVLHTIQELRSRPVHEPKRPPYTQRPFARPRHQPRRVIPGFRPGPSPPAHILPASSTIRAPRHVLMKNRLLQKASRQQDIPVIRRSMDVAESMHAQDTVPSDAAAAREDSAGFIVGMPDNFPAFSSIGGFGAMPAAEQGGEDASFVPAFQIPVIEIPDIPDNSQQEFRPPQFAQQKQGTSTSSLNDVTGIQKKISRRRRTAGEPDPSSIDPSTVPHRRVHRVESEGDIPHNRSPREFMPIPDSQAAFSDTPFHVEPFPTFEFPVFHSERINSPRVPTGRYPSRPSPREGMNRKVEIRTPDDDFIVPQSQRFYPNYNPRLPPPTSPGPHKPFFPSAPIAPRALGTRGGRFNGHGPGFREGPTTRGNGGGFRDFHDTFYGPGAHEAINKPDFVFPSSRRPIHRENEPLDNTLLGSGNFEVIRGGTFYAEDDHDIHHDGFDHLLHDSYYGSHNGPPSNNHVDDFFSNFRDFSEFAARRSDDREATLEDPSYYSPGFASEQIHHVINSSHPDFQDALANGMLPKETSSIQDQQLEESEKVTKTETKDSLVDILSKNSKHKKHRRPKNIQEVLEDLEAQPSDNKISSIVVDEKDPMLAMF